MKISSAINGMVSKLAMGVLAASLVGCSSDTFPSADPATTDPATTESVPELSDRASGAGGSDQAPGGGIASGRSPGPGVSGSDRPSNRGDTDRVPAGVSDSDLSSVTSSARPTPARPPTQPRNTVPGSPVPPTGVAAQLDYFVGGDNPCALHDYTPPSLPAIVPNAGPDYTLSVLEVPTSLEICFVGFSSPPEAEPLVVEIVAPSGGVVHSRTFTSEDFEWTNDVPSLFYSPIPDDEKGEYTVDARQGGANATWTFAVTLANTPSILAMYGNYYENSPNLPDAQPLHHFRTGEIVRVAFGGFSPQEDVGVHFYGPQPADYPRPKVDYFESRSFRVDSMGEGIFEFKVPANFPRGCFRIHNEKVPENHFVQFCAV